MLSPMHDVVGYPLDEALAQGWIPEQRCTLPWVTGSEVDGFSADHPRHETSFSKAMVVGDPPF